MEVILLERVEKLGAHRRRGQGQERVRPQLPSAQQEGAPRQRVQPQAVRNQPRADRGRQCREACRGRKGRRRASTARPVQLIRQASNVGHLYGSVSARDIVEALEGVGAKVTKSQVVLDRPIKAIGVHDVKIALHPEVAVTVKVNVARSPEEADLQAQGVDVIVPDVRARRGAGHRTGRAGCRGNGGRGW